MVKRNEDGSLKVVAQMPGADGWLREGGQKFRDKVLAEQWRLKRRLTDDEKDEISRSLDTD